MAQSYTVIGSIVWGLVCLGGLACGNAEPWTPPNVLLISVDTLRADRLGAYGYERPTSPQIDRWAERSVVFERAYTPATHTLPAHASLMSGQYPGRHGALDHERPLGDGVVTLAQMLEGQGYTTAGFVNVLWLTAQFNFERGFQTFDATRANLQNRSRSAEQTNAAVLQWADSLGTDPYFLFVHYFDVHSDFDRLPYDAPDEYRERFAGDPPAGFSAGEGNTWATAYMVKRLVDKDYYGEEEIAYISRLYDAGVAYTDHQLGELLHGLDERGRLEGTIVIVTSDHGEEFWEHYLLFHAQHFDEVVRVPFLVSLPEMRGSASPSCRPGAASVDTRGARPARVTQMIQHVDLVPTLADCLGFPLPEAVQGESFLPLLVGGEREARPAYFESSHGPPWGDQHAVVADGWKLLEYEGRETFLHDLENDPGEQRNLAPTMPEKVAELDALIAEHRRDNARLRATADRVELSPAEIEELKALGYLRDDPAANGATRAPSQPR